MMTFSISVSISPMPSILEAILSGWKASNSSSFSPIPTNLKGLPVTASTESAAPPLVSESSFVQVRAAIEQNPLGTVTPEKARLDTTKRAAGENRGENNADSMDVEEAASPMEAFEGAANDGIRVDISSMPGDKETVSVKQYAWNRTISSIRA